MNDRLGALCRAAGEEAGEPVAPLSADYLEDLALFNTANLEDVEEAHEAMRDQVREEGA